MAMLTVVAKVTAKKGFEEDVKRELLKLVPPTRRELGCMEYNLHQDNEDPAVFLFYETWESGDHLDKHMNTDHFKNYVSAVGTMIEEKIVHKMTRI